MEGGTKSRGWLVFDGRVDAARTHRTNPRTEEQVKGKQEEKKKDEESERRIASRAVVSSEELWCWTL